MVKAHFRWYNSLVAKKILITGITSLLGSTLTRVFDSHTVTGTFHTSVPPADLALQAGVSLDITNPQMVTALVKKIAPDVIVHLAAVSNIEYCQTHPQEAQSINVQGTESVVAAAQQTNAHLVFLSSSMVFSGASAPFEEMAKPHPVNVYGQTKHEAELIVQKLKSSTVIRAASLLGWQPETARTNDLTYYLPLLKENKPLHLVNDRFFNPLSALTAARAIQKIIEQEKFGVYHLAGCNRVTRFTLVKTIAEVFKIQQVNLIPIPSSYFPGLTPRPIDSTLATEKMKAELGVTPPELKSELNLLAHDKN